MSEIKTIISNNILPVELRDIPTIMKGDKGDPGRDGSFTQKAYKTYASMVADRGNIPADTSVLVNNDTDKDKNAFYTYDGTEFTKSDFDPQGILTTVDVRLNQAVESASEYFQSQVATAVDNSLAASNAAYNSAIEGNKTYWDGVFTQSVATKDNTFDALIQRINTDSSNLYTDIDGRVSSTINAAIDGVAIDANLVTDSLINTQGGVSQRTLNIGLNSISEMLALPLAFNGMRVFVKGLQGGTFIYDSTKSAINDGGIVINGWVRQIDGGAITPQMFGAKADGVAYDEDAIKSCISYAEVHKKSIWMGSKECIYRVKYNGSPTTFGSIFNITEGFNMQGAGAVIKVDQSPVIYDPTTQYSLFNILRPSSETQNLSYKVKDIYFGGINFEGGYVYANDTDRHNLNDKHKLRAISVFEVRLDNFNVYDCEFKFFAQNNTIVSYFSSSFDTYGIGSNINIDKCRFINCGFEGDHSTLYFMADDVTISNCTFYCDKEFNSFGSHAVEFHGSRSRLDSCNINNYVGGLVFGTNTQTGVGYITSCTAVNNVIEVYAGGFSVWSGEVANENGVDNVRITNNTVTLIDMDGRLLELGVEYNTKVFFNTPISGKILGTVLIQNNSVISKSIKPVYGADMSVGGGIQPALVDFSNNSLDHCQSAVRISVRGGVTGNIYNNIKVIGNNHYHYGDKGAFNLVEVDTGNNADNIIQAITLVGNTVYTSKPSNCTFIHIKSGVVDTITIADNTAPQGFRGLDFTGFNTPNVISNQVLGVADYLGVAEATAKTTSYNTDVLRFEFKLSSMTVEEDGKQLGKALGFLAINCEIVKVRASLYGGIATLGIPVTSDFLVGTQTLVATATVSNTESPTWGGDVEFNKATNKDNWGKLMKITFNTYDDAAILSLKSNPATLVVELTLRKVFR